MDVRDQAKIIIAEIDGDDFPVTKQTLIDLLAALNEATATIEQQSKEIDTLKVCCKETSAYRQLETDRAETIRAQTIEQCAEMAETWRGKDGISCSHRIDIAESIRNMV